MNKHYKVIAEAIVSGRLSEIEMPEAKRNLSLAEIKKMVKEEFEEAKSVKDLKVKELPFSDAELAKEVDWVKTLKLENFFSKK